MLPDITFEELKTCPWKYLVCKAPYKHYREYSSLFCSEAAKHSEKTAMNRALTFLKELCLIEFNLREGDPFTPNIVERLSDQHIDALYQFLNEVDDPELRARLADFIWLSKKKEYKKEAISIAIPEYIKAAENLKEIDSFYVVQRLFRAAELTLALGKGGAKEQKETFDYIETYLVGISNSLTNCLHVKLFEMFCNSKDRDLRVLVEKCKQIARYYEEEKNFNSAHKFLKVCRKLMKHCGADANALKNIDKGVAELFVFEANNSDSAMKKDHFIKKALMEYRNIGCSDKADELHRLLLTVQKKIPEEMVLLSSNVDITRLIQSAEKKVSGYSLAEALVKFSRILDIPDKETIKEQVKKSFQENPISSLGSTAIKNEKGKTTAMIPAVGFGQQKEDGINGNMFKYLWLRFDLYAKSTILSALDKINSEHSITQDDLIKLFKNSPFVPEDRYLIYAEGLMAGFKKNFICAASCLVPQIENSIRNILEYKGYIVTSKISLSGIQEEKRLDQLLIDENVINILEENTIFLLRGLLIEKQGGNFRNLLAHGLLSDEELQGSQSIFCWWLVLHLIVSQIPD